MLFIIKSVTHIVTIELCQTINSLLCDTYVFFKTITFELSTKANEVIEDLFVLNILMLRMSYHRLALALYFM